MSENEIKSTDSVKNEWDWKNDEKLRNAQKALGLNDQQMEEYIENNPMLNHKNSGSYTKRVIIFIIVAPIILIISALFISSLSLGIDSGVISIILVGLFFLSLFVFLSIEHSACPKCGKRMSSREIDRKIVDEYETTMDIEQEIRNSKGEKTGTYKQTVPAIRYIYDCTMECKYCGYTKNVKKQETFRK